VKAPAVSRAERLASLFKRCPRQWFDGRELAIVAGAYAWRTRVSELRRAPFLMNVENRQRVTDVAGARITISEYRYVPGLTAADAQGPSESYDVGRDRNA
jgi:hypothetical protein